MKLTDWLKQRGYGFEFDDDEASLKLTGEWICEWPHFVFSPTATIAQTQDEGCIEQDRTWIIRDCGATYRLTEFPGIGPNGEISEEGYQPCKK